MVYVDGSRPDLADGFIRYTFFKATALTDTARP